MLNIKKIKSKNLVVFAGLTPFMNNKVLDRSYMGNYHGGEALTDMAEAIQNEGYNFLTIDKYLNSEQQDPALLISDMAIGQNPKRKNIIPAICYSLESPIVASRYYHHINSKTKLFAKVYDWEGISCRIENSKSRFLPISWPTSMREVMTPVNWNSKKQLVMINSNKRALQWSWPKLSISEISKFPKALISNINSTWIKSIDPIMKSEIYLERLKCIKYFSKYEGFDLFGFGWDNRQNALNTEMLQSVQKCYRGTIPDKAKLEYLQKYKFSIVFENTVFPGYLTEKIFDCFFAGAIPIYLGDPKIEEKIPSDCFIDARKFRSYEALHDFFCSISEKKANEYLEAIREFISSSAFEPFKSNFFAKTIVNCLNEINLEYE